MSITYTKAFPGTICLVEASTAPGAVIPHQVKFTMHSCGCFLTHSKKTPWAELSSPGYCWPSWFQVKRVLGLCQQKWAAGGLCQRGATRVLSSAKGCNDYQPIDRPLLDLLVPAVTEMDIFEAWSSNFFGQGFFLVAFPQRKKLFYFKVLHFFASFCIPAKL